MPVIGEIKRSEELGRAVGHYYTWLACVDCGKQRWVRRHNGKRKISRCAECVQRKQTISCPKLRDIGISINTTSFARADRFGFQNLSQEEALANDMCLNCNDRKVCYLDKDDSESTIKRSYEPTSEFIKCPVCFTQESLWFFHGRLEGYIENEIVRFGKWKQIKSAIYHADCGVPCIVITHF